jgi:hypothetical protein
MLRQMDSFPRLRRSSRRFDIYIYRGDGGENNVGLAVIIGENVKVAGGLLGQRHAHALDRKGTGRRGRRGDDVKGVGKVASRDGVDPKDIKVGVGVEPNLGSGGRAGKSRGC